MIAKLTKMILTEFSSLSKKLSHRRIQAKSGQRALFSLPEYEVWGIKNAENELQTDAFISLWRFEDFTYGEHFAVRRELRGQGTGTKFWQRFCKTSTKDFALRLSRRKRKPQSAELHFMSETDLP